MLLHNGVKGMKSPCGGVGGEAPKVLGLYFSLNELFSGTMRFQTKCSAVVSFVSTI